MNFSKGILGKRVIKPSTSDKKTHYHSDGSGRDKYIMYYFNSII